MIELVKKLLGNEQIKFVIAGGFGFVLEFILMILLVELLSIHYSVSSAMAFIIGVVVNYILCKVWIFDNTKKENFKSFILFLISAGVGLIILQLLMFTFVEVMDIHYTISRVFSSGLVMIFNYFTKKFILVDRSLR